MTYLGLQAFEQVTLESFSQVKEHLMRRGEPTFINGPVRSILARPELEVISLDTKVLTGLNAILCTLDSKNGTKFEIELALEHLQYLAGRYALFTNGEVEYHQDLDRIFIDPVLAIDSALQASCTDHESASLHHPYSIGLVYSMFRWGFGDTTYAQHCQREFRRCNFDFDSNPLPPEDPHNGVRNDEAWLAWKGVRRYTWEMGITRAIHVSSNLLAYTFLEISEMPIEEDEQIYLEAFRDVLKKSNPLGLCEYVIEVTEDSFEHNRPVLEQIK